VVSYPSGLDDQRFRSKLYDNGVLVAGGLAEMAGKVFRMGHMGNLSPAQILFALEALEKTLESLGIAFQKGAGTGAARAIVGG
jgi:alanine-glyoxylate transaminase/serine-glyoxylate transaminase/serine-pyruvate transaminase